MVRDPTPLYARWLQGLVRPFPNFDFSFIRPVRARAVELMQIRPGARVLDAGCGTGASFRHLVEAAGPGGEVVGIDISAGAAAHARRRADHNRWHNVHVLVAPAQGAAPGGRFDALLMFAAPDVFASPAALGNLLPRLNEGARVVFFGAKTSTRPLGWLLNRALHFALTRLSLPDTPGLELEPWRHAAPYLRGVEIEEFFYGWMFLASGTLRAPDNPVLHPHPYQPV